MYNNNNKTCNWLKQKKTQNKNKINLHQVCTIWENKIKHLQIISIIERHLIADFFLACLEVYAIGYQLNQRVHFPFEIIYCPSALLLMENVLAKCFPL